MLLEGKKRSSVMYDVLHVPDLACNLFSVRAAVRKGNKVVFSDGWCHVRDRNDELCATGSLVNKTYVLHVETEEASVCQQHSSADLWHQLLGHMSNQKMSEMVNKQLATGISLSGKSSVCESCVDGKMQEKPFKSHEEIKTKRKLELVHVEVCGPMHAESHGGSKYFVTFMDDYSQCSAVYFMKQKSEVFKKFKEYEALVTSDCKEQIGMLRSENGGEYMSREFELYLKSKGIRHETSCAYTPEQNGVAERLNRTLVESARSMIAHAWLPNTFWAEAISLQCTSEIEYQQQR